MSFWLICPRKCISSYGRGSDRLLIYVNLKNNIVTTWKLRVLFFSSGIFRTSSLEGSISSYPVSPSLRKWGGEWGYIGVFQGRAGSQNIKRLLLIKENQKSQVKKFSTFLCIGRCKSLGSLKSFLWYAPQLSQHPVFSHPKFPQGSPYRVAAVCWLIDERYSVSFPSSLRARQLTLGGGCMAAILMTIISFIYWYALSLALSAHVCPWTIHFQVLDKSPF